MKQWQDSLQTVIQMRLDDGTILMHGRTPYDPVKAHEYYLRTRQLKGRKKGSTYSVRSRSGKTVVLTQRELNEQRAYAVTRINNIKTKLVELNTKLREALKEAGEKKAKAERKADKAPTAAEKSEAARESKKYRDKHQQELSSKRAKATKSRSKTSTENDPVATLQAKIGEIKKRLSAAVAIQRALAGATKNK